MIVAGILVGMQARNIDTIFAWIMIILGTAVLMPNVLRWFWWRFNGWGYAMGTLCGVLAAVISAIWFIDVPIYISFFVLLAISNVTSVSASLLTRPTEMETLKGFYRRIRPPGAWGPVKAAVLAETPDMPFDSFAKDLFSAVIAGVGLHCLFMSSCYACTKQWHSFMATLLVVGISAVVLYFTWYKNLPEKDEGMSDAGQ